MNEVSQKIKERLLIFIEFKGLTKKRFEQITGLSNGYLNNFKGNLGGHKLECILTSFPELNKNWLLFGEGEMLKSETSIGGDSIIQTGQGHNAVINKNKYSGKFAGIPEGSQLQYLMEQNKQLLQQNQKFQEHIDRLLGIIEDMSKK